MKRPRWLLVCLLGLALLALCSAAQTNANAGFEKLKSVVGDWTGKMESGRTAKVSYRLVSNRSALLETLQSEGEPEMVTLYTGDGRRVLVTHYCSAGNQPHMRTRAAMKVDAAERKLEFFFVDAANLPDAANGHMHHLTVKFEDNDHFTQYWTWRENGKDKTEAFHFTRAK